MVSQNNLCISLGFRTGELNIYFILFYFLSIPKEYQRQLLSYFGGYCANEGESVSVAQGNKWPV